MVFQPQNTQPQNFSGQPQNRKIFRAARSLLCSRVDEILRYAPDDNHPIHQYYSKLLPSGRLVHTNPVALDVTTVLLGIL